MTGASSEPVDHQFRDLMDNLPGVAYRCANDDGWTVFHISAYIEEMLGYSPDLFYVSSVSKRPMCFQDLILPEDMHDVKFCVDQNLALRQGFRIEYRMLHADGRIIWVQEIGRGVFNDDGDLLFLDGFIWDVTELHLAREALLQTNQILRTEQKRLEDTSRMVLLGHWEAWLTTGELWWSDVIYDIFGLDKEVTTPSVDLFFSFVHPEDIPLLRASEARAIETGIHDVEHRIIRADGQIRWVREFAETRFNSDGTPFKLVGTVQDISDRKHSESIKQEFISTISHELRTPLTAIAGALGLLKGGIYSDMPVEMRQLLEMASRNADQLSILINDLLDIEALAQGTLTFKYSQVDLQQLLPEVIASHQVTAAQRGILIDLQMTAAGSLWLDPVRFRQIISNLLSNAIKFSPDSGVVTVSMHEHKGDVVIQVEDQGPGVPVEFQPFLFQRFSQADGSDKRSSGGMGLGLFISRNLAQEMYGSIGYDPDHRSGACFWVKWPLHSQVVSRLPEKSTGRTLDGA